MRARGAGRGKAAVAVVDAEAAQAAGPWQQPCLAQAALPHRHPTLRHVATRLKRGRSVSRFKTAFYAPRRFFRFKTKTVSTKAVAG
jgi:hypothetical protein